MLATKVWLKQCMPGLKRAAQRHLSRELLDDVCRLEGVLVTKTELALSGLELIELFAAKYQLGLSIAHCSGMIAIALAPGAIGIDCEAKGKKRNWSGIATQFFTSEEAQTIVAAKPDEHEAVFLRHWVLKEAYIKANRGSLFPDLNSLVLVSDGFAAIFDTPSPGTWRSWEMEVEGFPIAICTTSTRRLILSLATASSSEATGCTIQSLPRSLAAPIRIESRKSNGFLDPTV